MKAGLRAALWRLWFPQSGAPQTAAQYLQHLLLKLLTAVPSLVGAAVARKRYAVRRQLPAPPIPVIVVGNLVVGGTGKTPVVASLATALTPPGTTVGILSRGYGRESASVSLLDNRAPEGADSDTVAAKEYGDEPLWLARYLAARGVHAIVGVGAQRAVVLDTMLKRYPQVRFVIADDGLQHAALPRSVELVVFDEREVGNGKVLPAGPLREPLALALEADAWLWRKANDSRHRPPCFQVSTRVLGLRALCAEGDWHQASQIHALAGIAQPENFLKTLMHHTGLAAQRFVLHPLPDHASQEQLSATISAINRTSASGVKPVIITTSKDEVKLTTAQLALAEWWVLDIEAELPVELVSLVAKSLKAPDGPQTA
jgi:tetraacyldisaccharide 4'-kinase